MTKTYIRYFYPGILVSESSDDEVPNRDIPKKIPKRCYCFNFFDKTEVEKNGEVLEGKEKNHSKLYYPGGRILNKQQVIYEIPDNKILLSNMEVNDWDQVVQTRFGNFQPFYKDNIVIVEDIPNE